jgi:hypothetical protein
MGGPLVSATRYGRTGTALTVCALCVHCALTVHSLCTHCALTVHSLCTHCALTVHSLCTHCALTVHSPCTHCALILCTHTVHPLCTHRTHYIRIISTRTSSVYIHRTHYTHHLNKDIIGFYIDDDWGNMNANGPSEMEGHAMVDMGLTAEGMY